MDIKVGDRLEVIYTEFMSRSDLNILRKLDHVVTVDDLDIINGFVMGFYTKEIKGYLFTPDQCISTND
jgi:hypothetical protein